MNLFECIFNVVKKISTWNCGVSLMAQRSKQEKNEALPPHLLSQQRPGLQDSLHLVLLFDRKQRLEEFWWLRGEDFERAGDEKVWALWNRACMETH